MRISGVPTHLAAVTVRLYRVRLGNGIKKLRLVAPHRRRHLQPAVMAAHLIRCRVLGAVPRHLRVVVVGPCPAQFNGGGRV